MSAVGTPDLDAKIPANVKMRGKLPGLVRFLESRTLPELSPTQGQDLEKGQLKLKSD